ncbi:type I restriction endonuclease subunit S [Roseomonas sp. KE2513]|uniref:restriction endonuclease subunit S n=1 Tax=Roseomonas sp. KE2513 TaxID=2479202 RepID=UPI0018DF51CF|nr:restriction endonuclease subunit S [Roseomonas sp. KE2513]MBI0539125.1 type I restriction endonuclease subunit S [Roseomonas sp. KE2513]
MSSAPADWLRAPLNRVGGWRSGSTPSKSYPAYWSEGTIPWVSPKDIKQVFIETAIDKVTQQAVDDTGLQIIPPGSIVFVTRSGILAHTLPMAVTTVPIVINQDIKALTPVADLDPVFLYYQLFFQAGDILRRTLKPGTTVQSIDFEGLKNIEVVLPPLSEQRAIAQKITAVVASLDGARVRLDDVFVLVDAYERALVRRILSSAHPQNGKLQVEPRDTYLSTLGDIADIQSGLTLGKRYGSTELVSRPYLRVANVQRGYFDLSDVKEVLVTPTEAERYRLRAGDILMNEGGDRDKLGRGWVWREEIPDCIHQNHVYRIRLKDRDFPPEFVSLYANEIGREYFLSEAKQTTNLASISKSRLSAFPTVLPSVDEARIALSSLEEQRRWVHILRSQAQTVISAVDAARRATFRKAFEGRLAPRAEGESFPALKVSKAVARPALNARRKEGPNKTGPKMRTLSEFLTRWPENGITFEALREQVPSDYETLRDAIFELLAGAEPKLEQRYDPLTQAMCFFRRVS